MMNWIFQGSSVSVNVPSKSGGYDVEDADASQGSKGSCVLRVCAPKTKDLRWFGYLQCRDKAPQKKVIDDGHKRKEGLERKRIEKAGDGSAVSVIGGERVSPGQPGVPKAVQGFAATIEWRQKNSGLPGRGKMAQ